LRIAGFEGFILYGTVFVGILLQYFLGFWLLNFDVYPNGFITILLLPAMWLGSFLLIYQNFIIDLPFVYQFIIVSVFLVLQYYFMSTQNILNLAHFRSISLSHAAFTTNNFYTILTFFITNLAIFLLPGTSNTIKLFASFVSFVIILFIFAILNAIEQIQLFFAIFFYFTFIAILSFLYIVGFIDPQKILLLVIAMSLVFRGVIVLSLYSVKKVISKADYIQSALESGLLFLLIGFASR
jgi:hypothetical protein